jgi:rhomboid family GlyGly-CTERM serine protease
VPDFRFVDKSIGMGQGTSSMDAKRNRSSVNLILFFVIILILNSHIIGIFNIRTFLFLPDAVASGQWWRLLTFPFVHTSWYHLVLDVGAFLFLYSSIRQNNLMKIIHVFSSGFFSLLAAYCFSPEIQAIGLCGLSGVDHGLLSITALEMIKKRNDSLLGYTCLVLVIAKSVYEVASGLALFSSIYLGLCGTPIVACHLGGVVGGVVSFFFVKSLMIVKK